MREDDSEHEREDEREDQEIKRQGRAIEMKRDERKDDFLRKMFETPQICQMNKVKMFRKIPFGRIKSYFSFESSESYRVFNYLHDSNSIFLGRGN